MNESYQVSVDRQAVLQRKIDRMRHLLKQKPIRNFVWSIAQMFERYIHVVEIIWNYLMPTHVIVAGDTFWNLSHRYGCTLDEILAVNPNVIPTQLQIGQVIQLPDNGLYEMTSFTKPSSQTL